MIISIFTGCGILNLFLLSFCRQLCDEILGPLNFDAVQDRALEMGGAGTMLTEFGLCYPDKNNPGSSNTEECEFVIAQMERR